MWKEDEQVGIYAGGFSWLPSVGRKDFRKSWMHGACVAVGSDAGPIN